MLITHQLAAAAQQRSLIMQRPAAAGGRRRGDPYPGGVNPPGTGADALGTAAEAGPWPGHPQPAMPISRNSGCRLARSGALRNRRQRAAAAEANWGRRGRSQASGRARWRSRLARLGIPPHVHGAPRTNARRAPTMPCLIHRGRALLKLGVEPVVFCLERGSLSIVLRA